VLASGSPLPSLSKRALNKLSDLHATTPPGLLLDEHQGTAGGGTPLRGNSLESTPSYKAELESIRYRNLKTKSVPAGPRTMWCSEPGSISGIMLCTQGHATPAHLPFKHELAPYRSHCSQAGAGGAQGVPEAPGTCGTQLRQSVSLRKEAPASRRAGGG